MRVSNEFEGASFFTPSVSNGVNMEATVIEKLNPAVSDACARQDLRLAEIKEKRFRSPCAEKPWQMTQQQYGDWIAADADRMFARSKGVLRDGLAILGCTVDGESLQEAAEAHYTTGGYAHSREGLAEFNNAMHKAAVQGALRAKKDVRADVLADYPELAPKLSKALKSVKRQVVAEGVQCSLADKGKPVPQAVEVDHPDLVESKYVAEDETIKAPQEANNDGVGQMVSKVEVSMDSLKQAYTEHLEENPSLDRNLDEVAGNPNRVDLAVQNIEALSAAQPKIIARAEEIESSVRPMAVSSVKVATGHFGRREEEIKLAVANSKAAGAQHLDQISNEIRDLRGVHVKSLRNGSRGTAVNVDSENSILVRWDDAESAEINGGTVGEDSPVICGDDAAEFVVDGQRKVRFDRQNDRFIVEGAEEKRRR
jgi:2-oxo-4-hydroxy-4-carboxy--5-ureidoimidazoline (OHCU) decarboxylase